MARFTYIPNRVIDSDGISDGANIYFYQTGTTTPITVYSDAALTTPVSNPYAVASGGAVPALYYAESSIRVRVVDNSGAVVSDDDPYERPVTQVELDSETDGKGADLVRYTPNLTTTAISRGVGDKLDENRSVLDFIPFAQHSAIKDGTSTWDAASTINAGIVDVGGKHIDMTAARKLAIGSPIDLIRGTFLKGNNSFDTDAGKASTIFLLNGANCAAIRTPSAASNAAATHYMGLEGLLIDGNGANQTVSTPGGIVQFYGLFVGSYMRMVFVRSSRGPGIVLGNGPDQDMTGGAAAAGMDVTLDHVWVNGSILDSGEYAFDTNMAFYASNSNGDFSAQRSGLCQINYLFVENPKAAFADDPRNDLADRTRDSIRFHAIESLNVGTVHVEGAIRGITLTSNRSVSIAKPSGAWIGDNSASDEALISIGTGNQAVHVGESIVSAGTPASPLRGYPVRKASGYTSTDFPDMPQNASGQALAGSYTARNSAATKSYHSGALAPNVFEILKSGGTATLRLGNADDSMTEYGFIKQSGDQTLIGSNANQVGDTTFISFLSNGDASDRILFSDPIGITARTSGASIPQGYMCWVGPTAAAQYMYAVTPGNLVAAIPVITQHAGTPVGSVTPISGAGRHFVYDTSGNDLYCSTGATSSDWKKLTP